MEEEYDALDERLAKNPPKLGPNGIGYFSRNGFQIVGLDEDTAKILNAKATASRQTPSKIIDERSEIAPCAHIYEMHGHDRASEEMSNQRFAGLIPRGLPRKAAVGGGCGVDVAGTFTMNG